MTEDEFNTLTYELRGNKEDYIIAVMEREDNALSSSFCRSRFVAQALIFTVISSIKRDAELNGDSEFVSKCEELIKLIDVEADDFAPLEGSMKQ